MARPDPGITKIIVLAIWNLGECLSSILENKAEPSLWVHLEGFCQECCWAGGNSMYDGQWDSGQTLVIMGDLRSGQVLWCPAQFLPPFPVGDDMGRPVCVPEEGAGYTTLKYLEADCHACSLLYFSIFLDAGYASTKMFASWHLHGSTSRQLPLSEQQTHSSERFRWSHSFKCREELAASWKTGSSPLPPPNHHPHLRGNQ